MPYFCAYINSGNFLLQVNVDTTFEIFGVGSTAAAGTGFSPFSGASCVSLRFLDGFILDHKCLRGAVYIL